jgi:hypothetical protein
MSELFRPLILNAVPEQHWSDITRFTIDGVALADNLIANQKMLNWWVGQDQRGDLRRVGVMFKLYEACQKKLLPFSCETKANTIRNCHHIEIASQNLFIHVTRTSHFSALPRDTTLRDNARISNQGDLFDGTLLTTDLSKIRLWYAYLTFNADQNGLLTHLAIGLPESVGTGWLDILSILKDAHSRSDTPSPEPQPPGPEELMKFHKHIEEIHTELPKKNDVEKK